MDIAHRRSIRTLVRGTAVAALLVAAVIGGCGKKKAPPPPPPPPPVDNSPPPVSFESIRQEMKADARLQFSDSLGTVTDEGFARAAVDFADAFVKGDAAKLKGMMGRRGQDVLETLEDTGEWAGIAKNIEGLRVIAAGTVPSDMAIEGGFPQLDDSLKEAQAVLGKWQKVFSSNMTPEDKVRAMTYLERDLRVFAKRLKETGRESDFRKIDQYVVRLLNMPVLKPGNIFSAGYNQTFLFAIQEPGVSYLAGWQAQNDGSKWLFDPASTTDGTKPRATDWDAVGMNGFALVHTVDTLIAGNDGGMSAEDFTREQEKKEQDAAKPPTTTPTPTAPRPPSGG